MNDRFQIISFRPCFGAGEIYSDDTPEIVAFRKLILTDKYAFIADIVNFHLF